MSEIYAARVEMRGSWRKPAWSFVQSSSLCPSSSAQFYDVSPSVTFTRSWTTCKHWNWSCFSFFFFSFCFLTWESRSVQTEFERWADGASGLNPERRPCLILHSTGWIFCSSTCSGLQSAAPRHSERAAGIHKIHPQSHRAAVRPFHSESSEAERSDRQSKQLLSGKSRLQSELHGVCVHTLITDLPSIPAIALLVLLSDSQSIDGRVSVQQQQQSLSKQVKDKNKSLQDPGKTFRKLNRNLLSCYSNELTVSADFRCSGSSSCRCEAVSLCSVLSPVQQKMFSDIRLT